MSDSVACRVSEQLCAVFVRMCGVCWPCVIEMLKERCWVNDPVQCCVISMMRRCGVLATRWILMI